MAATFPRSDQAFLAWAQNFYAVGNPIATSLGLTSAQFTAFNALVTTFQTCLAACDPGVRNRQATAAKSLARRNLHDSAKLLVNVVDGQASVTDAQKIQLGINVRKPPVPSPVPATAPFIEVESVSGFTVKIRLRAAGTGKKRGKPAGVSGASFFSFAGENPPADVGQWKFEGNTGKTLFDVQFPNTLARGTVVWFTALWFNGAKLPGPMTPPVSTVLQGGTVTMTVAERQAA
jgi:hypothetical protein